MQFQPSISGAFRSRITNNPKRLVSLFVLSLLTGACGKQGDRNAQAQAPTHPSVASTSDDTPPPSAQTSASQSQPVLADSSGCRSWANLDTNNLPVIPPSKYAASLDEVWRKLLEKHYDATLNCKDWPAIRQAYAAQLVGVQDAEQAFAVINKMLGELEQSHLVASPDSSFVPPSQKRKSPHAAESSSTKPQKPVETASMGHLKNIPIELEHRYFDPPKTKNNKQKFGGVGYIRFNVWLLPLLERFRNALGELKTKGIDSLIIDLRGNPGGVGQMAVPIARMLSEQSGSLGSMQLREITQHFRFAAGHQPFTGRVVILIDQKTGSTSEIFAQGMKDLGRATIVGASPSAGAALPSVIERLDSGGTLQFVVANYQSVGGTIIEGRGVVPDLLIDPSTDSANDPPSQTKSNSEPLRPPGPKNSQQPTKADPVLNAALRFLQEEKHP